MRNSTIRHFERAGHILRVANISMLVAGLSYCIAAFHNIEVIGGDQQPSPTVESGPVLLNSEVVSAAEEAIRNKLRDPNSAQFSDVIVHQPKGKTAVACGYVNAKNAYGGYIGRESFISNGVPGVTTALASDLRWRVFRKAWKQLCVDAPPRTD